jgi:hypothetical protein
MTYVHNMFSIGFDKVDRGPNTAVGLIRIGGFCERFESALTFWRKEDYVYHWGEAILRVITGDQKSCLITSVTDPENSNFLNWWPVYKLGDNVAFQNHIFFLDTLECAFDVGNPFIHVPDRIQTGDDGERISEWTTGIADLAKFLQKIR